MMTAFSLIALALIGYPNQENERLTQRHLALVSSCLFKTGQSAHIIFPIGSEEYYISLRNISGGNDLSMISFDQRGRSRVEANGGIGKRTFLIRIQQDLLDGPFRILNRDDVKSYLVDKPSRACRIAYTLSPK